MDKSWDGKETCAKSGEDGFGVMWETRFACSVANIGVVDVLVHSPDTRFGMEAHILPAAGSQLDPFWELPSTKGSCLASSPGAVCVQDTDEERPVLLTSRWMILTIRPISRVPSKISWSLWCNCTTVQLLPVILLTTPLTASVLWQMVQEGITKLRPGRDTSFLLTSGGFNPRSYLATEDAGKCSF